MKFLDKTGLRSAFEQFRKSFSRQRNGILATQSIRDVVPESCSTEELSKLKTLFELSQYKFILQQDNNAKKAIAEIFSNQITTSEIELIPFLRKGECVMAINGDRNLTFKIDATNEELKLFEGGA